MPEIPTYPGVYVEENPGGVHAIAGVATSIAAFIGWSAKGPVDRAVLTQGWPDFEREYGGLDIDSLLGYAVAQFFLNGGRSCFVIRLVGTDARPSSISLGSLKISARNPGKWGDHYGIRIKNQSDDAARFQLELIIKESSTLNEMTAERFENLSMSATDGRYVINTIIRESGL